MNVPQQTYLAEVSGHRAQGNGIAAGYRFDLRRDAAVTAARLWAGRSAGQATFAMNVPQQTYLAEVSGHRAQGNGIAAGYRFVLRRDAAVTAARLWAAAEQGKPRFR